ncbi:hypothetical protein ACFOJE_20865 [Azotobacter bryophylli]|jgi:hypothetical protein|uniref:DUF3077 domain-containing protein n=1 Tax=Azotobacter bryophylli TaxID=1986537 RepID=A0ABV7B1P0_9GAMM
MSRTTLGITFRATPPADLAKKGNTDVLCTVQNIDADLALDGALDLLDAARGGLLNIVDEENVSRQVVLVLHALESATALVRAAFEGEEVAND